MVFCAYLPFVSIFGLFHSLNIFINTLLHMARCRDRDGRRGGGGGGDSRAGYTRESPPSGERGGNSSYVWVSRKQRGCQSNFDVKPPNGSELPPIAINSSATGVPNSYMSFSNSQPTSLSSSSGQQQQHNGSSIYQQQSAPRVDPNAATRHARRVYAGGMPQQASEIEIETFFNTMIRRALVNPSIIQGNPVVKIYLNSDKCYAFVELQTIELCTACMQLDGMKFEHYTGTTTVRVRRPNDYRPDTLPPPGPAVQFNLAAVGILPQQHQQTNGVIGPTNNASVSASKIFIGGLPYTLSDQQVMELLSAFGEIRAFNQVRDPTTQMSKGYAFCEYKNVVSSEQAVLGLNGMKIGEKSLTVRPAVPSTGGASGGAGQHVSQMLKTQQPQQPYGQQQVYGGMGGSSGGNSFNPLMSALSGMGGAAAAAPPSQLQSLSMMSAPGLGGYTGSIASSGSMYGMPPSVAAAVPVLPAMPLASISSSSSAILATLPPTRVLLLTNMVTGAELRDNAEYEDIREDVRLECADHGAVIRVLIPRECDGYMSTLEGLIFVEFVDPSGARAAALALNGRKFADKIVAVQYFDEKKFSRGDLI